MSAATAAGLTGTVTSFDEAVGLGDVATDEGHVYPFHCIVIADGSRTIAVGARVRFGLLPKLGRYEACDIRPDSSPHVSPA